MPRPVDALLNANEAAAMLGISRATFYRLPFFRVRRIPVSPGRVGYERADLELYKTLQRGAARAA